MDGKPSDSLQPSGGQPKPRRPLPRKTAENAAVTAPGATKPVTPKSPAPKPAAAKPASPRKSAVIRPNKAAAPAAKNSSQNKTSSSAAIPSGNQPRGKASGRSAKAGGTPDMEKKGMGLAAKFFFPITVLVAVALFGFGIWIQRAFAEVMHNDVKKAGIQAVNILARIGETFITQRELHPGGWVLTSGMYSRSVLVQKLGATELGTTELETKILSLGYPGASDVLSKLNFFKNESFVDKKNNIKTSEDLAKALGFDTVNDAKNAIQAINANTPVIQNKVKGSRANLLSGEKAVEAEPLPYIGLAEAPLEIFDETHFSSKISNLMSDEGVLATILPVELKDVTTITAPTDVLDATIAISGTPNTLIAGARPAKPRLEIESTVPTEKDKTVNYDGTSREVVSVIIQPATLNRGGNIEECMLFTKTIKAQLPDGRELTGQAYLALSSNRIKAEQSRMRFLIFLIGGIAVLGVVALCFVITGIVSRPLKILMQDMLTVSGGDLTHTTEAHSSDEIGALASQFNFMTQKLLTAREAEREAERLESELEMAREIQMKLLPTDIPRIPGFDIHAVYHPAKEVGGDYYDFVPVDKEHLGVIVADVSGKGIPGSMVMATTRTILRFLASRNTSSSDTLARTNRVVAMDIRRGMFVTALYLVLNARTRQMCVSSAGHNPMAIFREATGEVDLINPNGIALGFDKGPIFERTIKQEVIPLNSGDRVVMYTDGVVEAMNLANEEYSDERFYAFVKTNARLTSKEFVDKLLVDLDKHKGDAEQHDDITVVTFRIG